jgi:hypothetical protein
MLRSAILRARPLPRFALQRRAYGSAPGNSDAAEFKARKGSNTTTYACVQQFASVKMHLTNNCQSFSIVAGATVIISVLFATLTAKPEKAADISSGPTKK